MHLKVPPPILGLLAAGFLWIVDWAVPELAYRFAGQGTVAVLMAAIGLGIGFIALSSFRRAETTVDPRRPADTSAVVATGIYRISRNPMYLGLLIVLIGWAVWLGNPLGVVVIGAFVWVITELQIKPEEEVLGAQFGESYLAYCRTVRRWL